MTLAEGIKNSGSPFVVTGSSRNELPILLKNLGLITGAEIGVYKAAYTSKLCKAGLKVYAIDPWKAYRGMGTGKDAARQSRQNFLYEHTQRVLAPYKDCTIIRKPSMEAIKDFEKESLDFVYIDGNHSFRYVAEDIHEWAWRVKSGGVVAGHDYSCPHPVRDENMYHVRCIVDAYVKCFRIENWYIFGDKERCASWMWFKK